MLSDTGMGNDICFLFFFFAYLLAVRGLNIVLKRQTIVLWALAQKWWRSFLPERLLFGIGPWVSHEWRVGFCWHGKHISSVSTTYFASVPTYSSFGDSLLNIWQITFVSNRKTIQSYSLSGFAVIPFHQLWFVSSYLKMWSEIREEAWWLNAGVLKLGGGRP